VVGARGSAREQHREADWALMKLFATDLDGTLLDPQDGIHPNDLAAIARARERGVIVTLATGRLTSRTHPIASAIGLDAPLVCADGGVLACSATQRLLRRRALARPLVEVALDVFEAASLARFVFTHEAIHSCRRGEAHRAYVRGWSHAITAHADIRAVPLWREDADAAIMVAGIGDAAAVERARDALSGHHSQLELFSFAIGDVHALRLMAKGASKGAALLELARELGVAREHIAVAGDWYNDISMFEAAGHAFAMPHAPPQVKAAASHVLDEDAPRRGAIAQVLERWLAELG
jgi:Cof subfamily protein (haloacid dehalogenase superfamily)